MLGKKTREYQCSVVNETVRIHLCRKRTAGLRNQQKYLVQCDQNECQYVEENSSHCPLNLSMFDDEIQAREEKARQRREESSYQ